MKLTPSLVLALFAGLSACQSTNEQAIVADLMHRAEFGRAIERSQAAQKEGAEWAADAIERARVGIILTQGRELLFEKDLENALLVFQEARRLAPYEPATETWLLKAERELAHSLLNQANLQLDVDDILGANASYARALTYEPSNTYALTGLARTERSLAYRGEQSAEYYREGLRSFRDFELNDAHRELSIAAKYDPTNRKATERRGLVEESLVEFHVARARGLADDGLWAAAQLELRMAKLRGPDDPEVQAEVDRVDAEVAAIRLVNDATMRMRRAQLKEAEALLDEASAISSSQTDRISRARADIEDARFELLYQDALGLERDYRHEEALAGFTKLLEQAEFYKDAIARRDTLAEFLEQAAELYEQAQGAEPAIALGLYRQIDVTLPEYKDVPRRIRELSAAQ